MKTGTRQDWRSALFAGLVSGVLIGTSFIPFPPWAALFCFVPLWWHWLQNFSLRKILISGWLCQFVVSLIIFGWVPYAVHEFFTMSWLASIGIFLVFCCFGNIHILIAGLAWFLFARIFCLKGNSRLIALPLIFSFSERLVPMIFPWHFGYSWLASGLPAFQWADTVGFLGLSALGLLINAIFVKTWSSWRLGEGLYKRGLVCILFLLVAVNVTGFWHRPSSASPVHARFLIVQGNILNQEKIRSENPQDSKETVIDQYIQLTKAGLQAHGPVDFIVWPETAFPAPVLARSMSLGKMLKLKEAVVSFATPLITGGYTQSSQGLLQSNAFITLNAQGEWLAPPYNKSLLLPFGEYLPGEKWFPFLKNIFPRQSRFDTGRGPTVLDLNGLKVGAQICYEGTDDSFSWALAVEGAQILINLTNDSWFGPWLEPFQHFYITMGRAVEVRRPLLRSTNNGITSVALADGSILPPLPRSQAIAGLYEVPFEKDPRQTAFVRWGHTAVPLGLILALLLLAAHGLWRRRR